MSTRDLGFCSVTFRPDGIIHTHFHKGQFTIDVDHVKQINAVCGELTNGKKVPMLIDGDQLTIPSEEARSFVAQKDSNPYSLAEAFLVGSLPQKLIANFFMRFNKPGRPTKMFTRKEEALVWLKGFLNG
jgi:hypothetical protein